MSDALAVITRVISEHHNIRGHVKLAGDTVSDIEAIFTLRKAYSGWTQSSTQALVEKLNQIQQAVSSLEEGLKNHFTFEEAALPPFLGEFLMKALRQEHQEISRQIGKAKTRLVGTKLEGLSQQELLSRKSEIQQMVNHLSQTVEEHAGHEEIILGMVEKAVASNG